MGRVFGIFSQYCLISMTASIPPESQGLEMYFLLKGDIFMQSRGSGRWSFQG